jgi:hypothetical protein
MIVKDYEGHIEKDIQEIFNMKTEEGEAISYDDKDSKIARAQYISNDEEN